MSEASTCRNCGRTSDEWVQFSHELGADVCWDCNQKGIADANAEAQKADGTRAEAPQLSDSVEVRIVTAEEFGAVEEPGAEPVLGEPGEAVFPEGGDVMIYGDGGASKTTLGIDGGYHLAAGDDWLGIPVPKPVNVLVIEAEGPRPLFRAKIRAKNEGWKGSDRGGRVKVMETPWASFRFPDAEEIADLAGDLEIDVLIVGPLTRVGMEELGTLQQVRDFMAEVTNFRERSGRRLLVILIHHENKGGAVSGAWEGAGDTLLHATVHSHGKTNLHFQKVRWSSKWHKETLELDWTEGEGFQVTEEPDRDLQAEIVAWLLANPYSTYREIAAKKEIKRPDVTIERVVPGIGANWTEVRDELEANQDVFRRRIKEEAKEVGRSSSAVVWEVRAQASEGVPEHPAHLSTPVPPGVGGEAGVLVCPPLGAHQYSGTPTPTPEGEPTSSAHLSDHPLFRAGVEEPKPSGNGGCVSHPDGPNPGCRYCRQLVENQTDMFGGEPPS